eukprot:PhF_6_TR32257/c0_g1_i1/m.47907
MYALYRYFMIKQWENACTREHELRAHKGKKKMLFQGVFAKVTEKVPWSIIGFVGFVFAFFLGDMLYGMYYGNEQLRGDKKAYQEIQQKKDAQAKEWSRAEAEAYAKATNYHKGFRGDFKE